MDSRLLEDASTDNLNLQSPTTATTTTTAATPVDDQNSLSSKENLVTTDELKTTSADPSSSEEEEASSSSSGGGVGTNQSEESMFIKKIGTADSWEAAVADMEQSPPNPPCWGWVVVVCTIVAMTPIAGLLGSFGNLVQPFITDFETTKTFTGVISGISFGLAVGLCPLSTPLFSKFGARKVSCAGCIIFMIGVIATSMMTSAYLLILTYSITLGFSTNLIFNPSMMIIGQYFPDKYQALASCMGTSGVSLGSMLMNPFMNWAIESYGWRTSFHIYCGFIGISFCSCLFGFREAPHAKRAVKESAAAKEEVDEEKQEMVISEKADGGEEDVDVTKKHRSVSGIIFTNPAVLIYLFATIFWSLAFLFPVVFLVDYAATIGIGKTTANQVIVIYSILELLGRFAGGFAGQLVKFSFTYICLFNLGFCAVILVACPHFQSLGFMYFYGAAIGINSGSINSLMFATTMQLFGNKYGKHVWGYINVMHACGMALGPMLGGAIVDSTNSYSTVFRAGSAVFFTSGLIFVSLKFLVTKYPLKGNDHFAAAHRTTTA